ncbi:MAG: hypothetical protein ACJ8LG_18845 [Massilia sp.]
MQLLHRHPLPSIRSKLLTLILACALPVLIGYFVFARDAELPAPGDEHGWPTRREDLARLVESLVQNNLKASAQFEQLRPALQRALAPQRAAELAEAIAMLRFDAAARLVREIPDLENKQ